MASVLDLDLEVEVASNSEGLPLVRWNACRALYGFKEQWHGFSLFLSIGIFCGVFYLWWKLCLAAAPLLAPLGRAFEATGTRLGCPKLACGVGVAAQLVLALVALVALIFPPLLLAMLARRGMLAMHFLNLMTVKKFGTEKFGIYPLDVQVMLLKNGTAAFRKSGDPVDYVWGYYRNSGWGWSKNGKRRLFKKETFWRADAIKGFIFEESTLYKQGPGGGVYPGHHKISLDFGEGRTDPLCLHHGDRDEVRFLFNELQRVFITERPRRGWSAPSHETLEPSRPASRPASQSSPGRQQEDMQTRAARQEAADARAGERAAQQARERIAPSPSPGTSRLRPLSDFEDDKWRG